MLSNFLNIFKRGPKSDRERLPVPMARYMGGEAGPLWAKWRPPLREPSEEVSPSWRAAAARASDLVHNLGWIAGAVDQAVANTIGTGLRLDARPDHKALGLGPKRAKAWAKMVEARWQVYASTPRECDASGQFPFGLIQAQALRSYIMTGEIVAEHVWGDPAPGGRNKGRVHLVPPSRLSMETIPSENRINGVRVNNYGRPIDYLLEYVDPFSGEQIRRIVPSRDPYGRNVLTHIYDGQPAQTRGITPLVPVLKVAKRFDELSEATLMASIIQSLFAATMTSSLPTEESIQGLLTATELSRAMASGKTPLELWLDVQGEFGRNVHFDTALAGRIAHLFPGQDLKFVTSSLPSTNYKDFSLHLLREMARCLGITYESMTGDYAGVTFSSVRMATDEIYRIVLYRRQFIIAPFCQSVYENWLEEEIESGRIVIPGGIDRFLENRSAICNSAWLGAPKPQADDLKAAKAYRELKEIGVISDAQIAAELGRDIEDVYAEISDEVKMRDRFGIRTEKEVDRGSSRMDDTPPEDMEHEQ